jgi:hypothetical protein
MHAVLAMTIAQESFKSHNVVRHKSALQAQYELECTKLLHQKLSRAIRPEDRDALWITAIFLGVLAMNSLEELVPEKVWPLKASSPTDLSWLWLGEGKRVIFRMTDPTRSGSIFHASFQDCSNHAFATLPTMGVDGIAPEIVELCHLDHASCADNNAYFVAAHALSMVRRLTYDQANALKINDFVYNMHPSFKNLLRQKDPVALILLGLWYSSRSQSGAWWVACRATVESKSIILYLRKYHGDDHTLKPFIDMLEAECTIMWSPYCGVY